MTHHSWQCCTQWSPLLCDSLWSEQSRAGCWHRPVASTAAGWSGHPTAQRQPNPAPQRRGWIRWRKRPEMNQRRGGWAEMRSSWLREMEVEGGLPHPWRHLVEEREDISKIDFNRLPISCMFWARESRTHHTVGAQICQSSCLCHSPSRCGQSGALRWPGCSTLSPHRSPNVNWGTGGCFLTQVCTLHAWSILKTTVRHRKIIDAHITFGFKKRGNFMSWSTLKLQKPRFI